MFKWSELSRSIKKLSYKLVVEKHFGEVRGDLFGKEMSISIILE